MRVGVIGVAAAEGGLAAGPRRGPTAIRRAGLVAALRGCGWDVDDRGDVRDAAPVATRVPITGARRLGAVAGAWRAVADRVEAAVRAGALPLVLGGDHSLSVGTLAGLSRTTGRTGVIWLDAHGDFNTPRTSPTGNLHGMALAIATGRGGSDLVLVEGQGTIADGRVVLLAVRSLDPGERVLLQASAVRVLSMRTVRRLGFRAAVDRAVSWASGDGRYPLHLSCDLDAIGPRWAPGVETPVPGGLSPPVALAGMARIGASGLLRSLEVVELDPTVDHGGRTARLAVALIAAALTPARGVRGGSGGPGA
jgi:arginase